MATPNYSIRFLGSIRLEHVLIEYDGPQLFTVRSSNGGRFLGFWAADNGSEAILWYCAVSTNRYRELLKGSLDLRAAFLEPEQDAILEAHWNHETACYEEAAWVTPRDLDQNVLPEPGFRLEIEAGEQLLPIGVFASANFIALQENRAVARIIFDRDDGRAPASTVARTLNSLQDVLDSIGNAQSPDAKSSGPIPNKVTDRTQLYAVPFFAGSLGIELVAGDSGDLFTSSLAETSLNGLLELIDAGSDHDKLREQFTRLTVRTARRYRKFMDSLAEAGTNVELEVGAPRPSAERHVMLLRSRIVEIIEALYLTDTAKPDIIEFPAELIMHNKRTRAFEVRRLSDQQLFKGKVTGAALDAAGHASLSRRNTTRQARLRRRQTK